MVDVKGINAYNKVAALGNPSVRIDNSLDYAGHELRVMHALKEIRTLLLRKDFVAAASTIDHTIVELRLMRAAIKTHIKESNE